MDIIGQCVLTVMSGEFVLEPVLRNVCETGAVIKCYFLLRSRVRLKSPRWMFGSSSEALSFGQIILIITCTPRAHASRDTVRVSQMNT